MVSVIKQLEILICGCELTEKVVCLKLKLEPVSMTCLLICDAVI